MDLHKIILYWICETGSQNSKHELKLPHAGKRNLYPTGPWHWPRTFILHIMNKKRNENGPNTGQREKNKLNFYFNTAFRDRRVFKG